MNKIKSFIKKNKAISIFFIVLVTLNQLLFWEIIPTIKSLILFRDLILVVFFIMVIKLIFSLKDDKEIDVLHKINTQK